MATNLDLEEQEQLDRIKHFWRAYGALISSALTVVLLGWAAWTGWQWWQRSQADKAAGMYVEIERVARTSDADRAGTWFSEMQQRYPGTLYAAQAGLLTAKAQLDKGQVDAARTSLMWVAEHGAEPSYRALARLRLAGLLLDGKKYDESLQFLGGTWPAGFEALADDRRGDVLMAQGKRAEAVAAYQRAFAALDPNLDYRRLLEAKLTALETTGASDAAAGASAPATTTGATAASAAGSAGSAAAAGASK